MQMYNPPSVGEFIKDVYLEPLGLSARSVAVKLGVSASTFTRLLNQKISVSPEMAVRLSIVFNQSPESWLNMQNQYDLWQLQSSSKPLNAEPLEMRVSHHS